MRQSRRFRQPPAPPQDSEANDIVTLAQIMQQGSGNGNPDYPTQYEQQEAQVIEQMIARRKAYMQRYGHAEQQYVAQTGKTGNALTEPDDNQSINDLFGGDL